MSETTGQHRTEQAEQTEVHGEFVALRSAMTRWVGTLVGAGLIALGSASLVFYTEEQANRARDEQIHERLERDLAALERDQREAADAADDLSGELRALKALVEAGHADQRARLERIERALDDRRHR